VSRTPHGTITTLSNVATIGIKEPKKKIATWTTSSLNNQNCITTNTTVTIGKRPHHFAIKRDALINGINDNKIVAKTMHFTER